MGNGNEGLFVDEIALITHYPLPIIQRLIQILAQILGILNPDRDPENPLTSKLFKARQLLRIQAE